MQAVLALFFPVQATTPHPVLVLTSQEGSERLCPFILSWLSQSLLTDV